MKRICVFCGSSPGSRPEYRAATEELGTELAPRNIGLVYGGGNVEAVGAIFQRSGGSIRPLGASNGSVCCRGRWA
jgi:predicted Rossmann-fold nucleotide-binding protein